jgi:hypothetical protein
MLKKWVDSLFKGIWHLQSGDVFACADADIDYYFKRSKEYLDAGTPLPVCLEHQPTVGLSHHDKLAEQTRNTIGHCHDVRIGGDGQLQFLVDGDEDALKIMQRNKFVSPEIRHNVLDSRSGKRWQGPSIVHLAVTPRPVQVTGKPHFQLSNGNAEHLSVITKDVSLSLAEVSAPEVVGDAIDAQSLSSKAHASSQVAFKASEDAKDQPGHMNAGFAHTTAGLNHMDAMGAHSASGGKDVADAHNSMAQAHMKMSSHHTNCCGTPMLAKVSLAATEEITPVADDDINLNTPDPVPDTVVDDKPSVGKDAHLIQGLSEIVKPLGIEVHTSPEMTLQSYVEHLCTAFKTHQATNGAGAEKEAEEQELEQENDPTGEVAESAPIMMSANEIKMAQTVVSLTKKSLKDRILSLHARGYIDDKMRDTRFGKLDTVKLSTSDVTPEGIVTPWADISAWVETIEELAASGKPGMFAKVAPKMNSGGRKLEKPISSVSLSNSSNEVAVNPPYEGDNVEGSLDPQIMDKLTQGRWSELNGKK